MTYCLAAAAASGVFIAAGWHGRHASSASSGRRLEGVPRDPLWAEDDVDLETPASQADAAAAIRIALNRLTAVMARQLVKVEIAAAAGLLVRMKGATLADLLEQLLAAAVDGAPASRVLVTATTYGDHIHIGVTDDMPGADPAVRRGAIRGIIEHASMLGCSLDVDSRPYEGTTMTLRLAAAATETLDAKDHVRAESDREPVSP